MNIVISKECSVIADGKFIQNDFIRQLSGADGGILLFDPFFHTFCGIANFENAFPATLSLPRHFLVLRLGIGINMRASLGFKKDIIGVVHCAPHSIGRTIESMKAISSSVIPYFL